ncbi:MAG: DNA primase [Candidatus Omnitrophica bacterium]|nr:DNA primase [Candidatus Omnitrophota bacterium]
MGLIAEDMIRQIIDRSDIIDVIGRYVTLKKAGNSFKALCPFHHEKTPSFVVNPDKQIFHCFGCGVGGDVVGFIMRQERVEFPQAVRFLADQAGIVIPEDQEQAPGPSKNLKDEIYKINEWALVFFHETLLTSRQPKPKAARDYLKSREVDLETVKRFRLGYAPDEWDSLIGVLKQRGVSLELMHQAGLVIAREKSGYYDRFRGRIIFPIFDINSRPVAFGARSLSEHEGAKYINSPETPVYTKGRHLFGLHLTKTSVGEVDHIVIVEGYMDMMMPFVHGVKNIAASLGTALTVDQIRLIRRYSSNVIMLFDTDPAGQAAIVRSLDLLIDEGMNVKVVTLGDGQDPDSFIRRFGVSALGDRLKQAQTLFDYKFNWLAGQFNPQTIEGKTKISQDMLTTISRFKSEVAKFELMRLLAKQLNVPETVILKQAQNQWKSSSQMNRPVTQQAPVQTVKGMKPQEELLIALFLDDHQWAQKAQELLKLEDFTEGLARDMVQKIWRMTQENLEWTDTQLMAKLEDQQAQSLVAKLLSGVHARKVDPSRVFGDCVKLIQTEGIEKQKGQLQKEIQETEIRGDTVDVGTLRRFEELNRRVKNRG